VSSETIEAPETLDELRERILDHDRVLAVGRQTKPVLSRADGASLVSLRGLSGIIEYEPSEFTFTAYAGTPIAEVAEVLTGENQYLPFDPLLSAAGATLGGTVASGIAGPGRLRYGGIRDFLVGVRFLSGAGEWITGGGKVVKNAAGFDLPKLLVGSLGRLGVLTELTFKVFPEPATRRTLRVDCEDHDQAVARVGTACRSRWEVDAVDYWPDTRSVFLRLAGPPEAVESLAAEVRSTWGGDVSVLDENGVSAAWESIAELSASPETDISAAQRPPDSPLPRLCGAEGKGEGGSAEAPPAESPEAVVIKVPTSLRHVAPLHDVCSQLRGCAMRVSVGGAVSWLTAPAADFSELDARLAELELAGLAVRGPAPSIWLGRRDRSQIRDSVKRALDPPGRFPPLDPTSHHDARSDSPAATPIAD